MVFPTANSGEKASASAFRASAGKTEERLDFEIGTREGKDRPGEPGVGASGETSGGRLQARVDGGTFNAAPRHSRERERGCTNPKVSELGNRENRVVSRWLGHKAELRRLPRGFLEEDKP